MTLADDRETGERTVTVEITGGLGNQFFQYAAGRALSIDKSARLMLDTAFYGRSRQWGFQLDAFPIEAGILPPKGGLAKLAARLASGSGPPVQREAGFHFDPLVMEAVPPVRLHGYFQSPRYFAHRSGAIRKDLTLPEPDDTESLEAAARMASEESASLHIRRGDYVNNQKNLAIYASCSIGYYDRAMQSLPSQVPVFVFSDDIAWAEENLPKTRELVFVGRNHARHNLADLWLMSRAHHHVIANSSFSWWGAYLAAPDKGLTIAPSKWFNDPAVRDHDLFPPNWTRMEI